MRILLADDDRIFQLMLGRTLPKWGYETIVVDNGEDAWRHLEFSGGPSIAILDWMMPSADGPEVCRRVRSNNLARYVYLILLTSKETAEDLMAGLEAGADDYLSKPLNPDLLRLRLRVGCRVLESESRHRHIAENASDGIVTIEQGNRIRFANSAAGAVFGFQRTELIGLDFATLVPDLEQYLATACPQGPEDHQDARSMRSLDPVEILGKHQTGRTLLLEVSFSDSKHREQGRVLTAMIRDVTERRRLAEQRAQTQKLESIGQLAAGVAHEINTPIQYIGGNLQFLRESCGSLRPTLQIQRRLSKELHSGAIEPATLTAIRSMEESIDLEYLEGEMPAAINQALEGVHHVAEIVRALKEFAHSGTVEMVPADLNHLIETTVLVSRNQWKYVADLKMELDSALPFVPCVAAEISQVLLNLIVNAADAISDAIKDRPGAKGSITISTRVADRCAEVRVTDSGTGIPISLRSKIFDPFFTTKEVGKGSGQGLALTHATIVQKHHGTITFETALDVGTTFIIRLPLVDSKDTQGAQIETYNAAAVTS